MCFFPQFNKNSVKDKWQPPEFDCGYCPECLAKKARFWALRCSMQAQIQDGYMITLTYDNYERDYNGKLTGRELPPNRDLHVCKTDCQKFIKRLRQYMTYNVQRLFNQKITSYLKKYSSVERSKFRKKYAKPLAILRKKYVAKRVEKISYLLTAEYGNRTGRAHYHALIFGLKLPDLVRYKRSKRGNQIYKSAILERLWNNGICTVDSININGKTARYCTKYCAKDSNRCDDTFMLFSHGIGDSELIRQFNAKSYIVDGREYPIPKLIWNKIIVDKFKNNYIFNKFDCTYKYRSLRWFLEKLPLEFAYAFSDFQKRKNKIFRNFKRSYKPYLKYLEYWKNKADIFNINRGNVFQRVSALPDDKYFAYKLKSLKALSDFANCGSFVKGVYTIPRSEKIICPDSSCHKGANDIKKMNFVYLRDCLSGKVVKKLLRSKIF